MKKLSILILALIVSACSLPNSIYNSPSSVVKKSNYELCRALYDVDERRRASSEAIRVLDGEIKRRGGNKEACFDLFLAKHGQNTICNDYQRAVALGEPTALVGFGNDIRIQDIEAGFDRNNIRCDADGYTGSLKSGLEVLGDKVDEYNRQTQQRENSKSTYDCRETARGVRCYEY